VANALFGSPRSLLILGSIPANIPRKTRRPNCLLPSPHMSTGPDRRVLGRWTFQRTSSEPSPKISERSAPQDSPLHPSLGSRPTSTSMDTGCPGLLMLLPLLRRKRPCLAPTLEIARHPENVVRKAAALTNVAGAIDPLQGIVRSHGATAAARGLLLDLPHLPSGIDTSEIASPRR
jgi:hypothetical protein